MVCNNCGKNVKKGSLFCNYCGQAFDAEALGAEQEKTAGKTKLILGVTAAVLALCVLAGVMYGFVSGAFAPRENNIFYKESYTANEKKTMGNRTSVVATVDDLQLTNGQLQVFYGMQYINFMNSDYGYYYGPNTTKPLDEQIYDEETGMTWQQFFLDTALSTWRRYALLAKEAKEVGFTLPSDMQKLLDSTEANLQETLATSKYETVDEMLQADFGTGCTLEDYLYYQDLYYYSNAYFSSMIDAFEISQDEIEAYFTEHEAELKANSITKTSGLLVDVRHILFQPTGGTTDSTGTVVYTDEAWEVAYEQAQKIYDELLSGGLTEEKFSNYAVKYSKDSNAAAGGLYTFVSQGKMVESFDAWCFDNSRMPGDMGMVKTKFGYHIIYYVEGGEGWIRYCDSYIRNDRAALLLEQKTDSHLMDISFKKILLGENQLGQ